MKRLGWISLFVTILIGSVFYWNGQRQQRQIQEDWLNRLYFDHVKLQNRQVLFSPARFGAPLMTNNSSFDKPMLMIVGSQFQRGDEHFFIKYKVSRIEEDGVTIFYEADGVDPSYIRSSSGNVKLSWK